MKCNHNNWMLTVHHNNWILKVQTNVILDLQFTRVEPDPNPNNDLMTKSYNYGTDLMQRRTRE